MSGQTLLSSALVFFEVALLFLTLMVTTRDTIRQTIAWYRVQCFFLMGATGLAAWVKSIEVIASSGRVTSTLLMLNVAIAFLPFALGWSIFWVFERATLFVDTTAKPSSGVRDNTAPHHRIDRIWQPFRLTAAQRRRVDLIWQKQDVKVSPNRRDKLAFVALLGIALLVAFLIIPESGQGVKRTEDAIALAVCLCLHTVGLYNMVFRRDIITQAVGLLIMDHGLYLAVVKIVAIPVPAAVFVTALYFYTVITLITLLFMIPQVLQELQGREGALVGDRETIDLDDIAVSSPLSEKDNVHPKTSPAEVAA
jgi:hydrogenase-4 membrane subunit HyfE